MLRSILLAVAILALGASDARAQELRSVHCTLPCAAPSAALSSRDIVADYEARLATRIVGTRRVGSGTLIGAGVGFVLGAGATYAVLHSGGSNALCDRSANQDAMTARECAGATLLGGAAGAVIGGITGRILSRR